MDSAASNRRPQRLAPSVYTQPQHKRAASAISTRPPASPPATVSSHARTRSHASGRPSTDAGSRYEEDAFLRSRHLTPGAVNVFPATPPDTSYGRDHIMQAWPGARSRDTSVASLHRLQPSMLERGRGVIIPAPPVSLDNRARRRRARSYSASTASDAGEDDATHEADPQVRLEEARSASALEIRQDLLELRIPTYKLGTPRWSARGTAYLRNSATTNTSDARSSVASQYDQLFPLPPGRRKGSKTGRGSTGHGRPQSAAFGLSPLRQISSIASSQDGTPATIFDNIEAKPHDPSVVRYAPGSAQIVAATVPRLIVQITSVHFLDYELLSDFFLAYRAFLSSTDLLDWLLERMRWAISSLSDTGRIVRVRTFVALRHWMLNYFADDFLGSFDLRRRFCDSVNRLCQDLNRRDKDGAGDLNILGELKKCWRRTAAQYFPLGDAMNTSTLADIFPGGGPEHSETTLGSSVASPRDTGAKDGARESTQSLAKGPQLFAFDERTNQKAKIVSIISDGSAVILNRRSIPASPLSEDSLTILSCSIPFLQKIRPGANAAELARRKAPRPAMARQNSLSRQKTDARRHRRDASFNDAVRYTKAPQPCKDPGSVAVDELPSITLTGGLVRGMLLAPPPPNITRYAVRSPPMDPVAHDGLPNENYFDDADVQHSGVKRIVGDVKRALSLRKGSSEASHRSHRSGSSAAGSRGSHRLRDETFAEFESTKAITPTPTSRNDVLAARLQQAYRTHFLDSAENETVDLQQIAMSFPEAGDARPSLRRWRSHRRSVSDVARRLGSQISTSPRSIVIIDATSLPALSYGTTQPAPDLFKPAPLFAGLDDYPAPSPHNSASSHAYGSHDSSQYDRHASVDRRLHQSFMYPAADTAHGWHRKSSDVQPSTSFEIKADAIPNQLRRRPGGDLRAADNVQDLVFRTLSDGDEFALRSNSRVLLSRNFSVLSYPTLGAADDRGRSIASPDSAAAETRLCMDRSSSQPQLHPSPRTDAQKPTRVEEGSRAGGCIEDALAKLEGKLFKPRNSGLSWFELPAENQNATSEARSSGIDANFEMISPRNVSAGTQIYRISRADHSDVDSISDHFHLDTKSLASSSRFADGRASKVRKSDVLSTAFTVQSSFLLDDNESLSDEQDGSLGARSFFFDDSASRTAAAMPPSATDVVEEAPTATRNEASKILGVPASTALMEDQPPNHKPAEAFKQGVSGCHLPFVLAFEAEVLAEQLCIIEKDALDEVDWKDLIALNWQHAPQSVRNWAEYLKREDPNGVDLVIARFNLMVKWVVSQCVLTEAISERARCISKFIHIAVHCLRLRNYASMYQITLALLSSDITRLQRTWGLVPIGERRMLDRLEVLCQPLRNFHNLRVEMESASFDEGCIPFIGLYTHDLTYNAQKPSELEAIRSNSADDGSSTLVNFEKFQTAAVVTKSLLRLLEASARYVFRPHPEALSRCLWLAALEDSEISAVGAAIE